MNNKLKLGLMLLLLVIIVVITPFFLNDIIKTPGLNILVRTMLALAAIYIIIEIMKYWRLGGKN